MLKIICVGKIKEKFYKEAIEEYSKRMSKYHKISIIEVKDYDFNNVELNLKAEKEEIERQINEKDYIITMEIEGKQYTSIEFSKLIDETLSLNSNIVFIIGGSNGIHQEIKQKSKKALSFSKMTFPHQLFRIVLLEQIYRSFKIKNNENYHK